MKRIYLEDARKRQGLTQVQLSEKSGIRQNQISRLETRLTRTSADVHLALAAALNLDPRQLACEPSPKRQKAVAA